MLHATTVISFIALQKVLLFSFHFLRSCFEPKTCLRPKLALTHFSTTGAIDNRPKIFALGWVSIVPVGQIHLPRRFAV